MILIVQEQLDPGNFFAAAALLTNKKDQTIQHISLI